MNFLCKGIWALSICLITGCQTTPPVAETANVGEKKELLEPDQARLKLSFQFFLPSTTIPASVYIFPPLRVNDSGIPIEEYVPSTDTAGNISWKGPSPSSENLKWVIESYFQDRGFRVVPFQEVVSSPEDHSILMVSPYFSGETILKKDENAAENTIFFFVSLQGFTFPEDLDPQKKRNVFTQNIWIYCREKDPVSTVMNIAFRSAVINIGKNRKYIDFVEI